MTKTNLSAGSSAAAASISTSTADRELVVRRTFAAPRELVWRAWTEPAHLIRWWGPRGFTNTFESIEVRPGGVWCFVMHGPDGADYPNLVVFEEVVPPERLAYTHGSGAPADPGRFQVTVTFAVAAEGTAVAMHAVFASVASFEEHRAMGAVEGANSTLDRLAEHLAELGGNDDA